MTVLLDHIIIWSRDQHEAAAFLAAVLGTDDPVPDPPFSALGLSNGVTLDYLTAPGPVAPQHYAFLVGDAEFDEIVARVVARGLPHWAGPEHTRPGQVDQREGGRGVYFDDPSGHSMEVIATTPEGRAADTGE